MNMEQVTVFFEGLGLPRFTFNKVAFTLFERIDVTWSAIVIFIGLLAGTIFAVRRGKRRERIAPEDMLEIILFGLIGARLLTVAENFGAFRDLARKEEWDLWGSLALSILLAVLISRFLRVRVQSAADVLAPALLLGGAIGSFSLLSNGYADSAWLRETSSFNLFGKTLALPSGEGSFFRLFRMGIYPNNEFDDYMIFVHPIFLYAAAWCFLGFVLLNLYQKHKAYDGQVFWLGVVWTCIGLIGITGLCTTALAAEVQWVAAIALFLSVARLCVLDVAYRKARRRLESGLLVIVKGDSAVQ